MRFERADLAEARHNAVRRCDERRQGIVAKMIDSARCFNLFRRCPVQQKLVANVGSDDVVDERAHVPLGTWRRSPPVVRFDESQPSCELVVGHHQQLERLSRRRHIGIVAPSHSADKSAPSVSARDAGAHVDRWTVVHHSLGEAAGLVSRLAPSRPRGRRRPSWSWPQPCAYVQVPPRTPADAHLAVAARAPANWAPRRSGRGTAWPAPAPAPATSRPRSSSGPTASRWPCRCP